MAPTQTTRLGVYRWASNDDEFTRAQMDTSHQNLEDLVALFTSGTFALRPAAAASNARGFYLATDTNVLYYSNGTAWFSVNSFASPVAIVPGDTIADGGSTFAAKADHKHSLPAFGLAGDIEPTSTTAVAGTDVLFARADHRHTIGAASVIPGSLAVNSINAANLFTAQVVERASIKDGAVNKAKLDSEAQIPSGTIWAYGGTSAPSGWLFCDGDEYAVSAQNDLYNAIGYQYGGSGANFNVPDLRDRMPRGSASTSSGLGVNAGSDTVTLATANMPSHLHGFGSLAIEAHAVHSHSIGGNTGTTLGDHAHGMSHGHTASMASTVVSGGGGFLGAEFYYPPGGAGNRYADGPYSMFDGGNGPQAEIGLASLLDGTINVSYLSANTGNANLAHSHTLPASTANIAAAQNHVLTGSTALTGSGTPATVTPKTQTVNYIIKT